MTHFQTAEPATSVNEVSFIEILSVLGEHKKFILVTGLVCALIAVVVSLLMTPIFTARTVFLPPQQQQSSSAGMLSTLNSIPGLSGGGLAGLMQKSPDEMYIRFLNSDNLQDSLIDDFKLKERYQLITYADTRKALRNKLKITYDKKSGVFTIEFDDTDPMFAANFANANVSGLSLLLAKLAITEAKHKRLFFDAEIIKIQESLTEAEQRFRLAQKTSGLQVPSIEAQNNIKSIAGLHGQISAREVQLQALRSFVTDNNADVKRLSTELSVMKSELNKLETGSGTFKSGSLQQEALSAYREMKIQENMLDVMVKQAQMARIDEAKESTNIQVVDVATPPERRTSPQRTKIVLLCFFLSALFAMCFVLIRNFLLKAWSLDENRILLSRLKRAWSL